MAARGQQVGSLYSSLTLESSSFVSGLKKSVDATASSSAKIEKHLSQIKTAAIAAFTGEIASRVVELGKAGLDYASSLGEVSQQLGVTSRDLQVYRYAASQVGVSQEEMDGGLQKFTKTLGAARAGNAAAVGTFTALGLSMSDVKKGDPHDVLLKAADGIAQIRDRATRAAPEIALFGKTGQQLDPLLSQGSAGINELATAAEKLGLVLSAEQIARADDAADKLSAVKQVLEANIAGAVADNAEAILSLATAIERVVVALAKLPRQKDLAAKLSLLNDDATRVDVPLALYNRVALGKSKAQTQADTVKELLGSRDGREALFNRTQAQIRSLNRGRTYDPDLNLSVADNPQAIAAEKARLLAFRMQIVAREKLGNRPANDNPGGGRGYTDPGAASAAAAKAAAAARAAEAARQKALRLEEGSRQALQQAADETLNLRQQLTSDVREQAQYQHEQTDLEGKAALRKIDLDVAEGQITAAAGEELKRRTTLNTELQHSVINRELDGRLDQADLEARTAAIGDQRDLLSAQAALANTAGERRDLELRLLDLQYDEERVRLAAVLASRTSTDAEKKVAQARMDLLPQLQGLAAEGVRQRNAGPLEQYRQQIKASVGDLNTSLETVEANGLRGLEDGLLGIVTRTESVSDAFGRMAESILADLARIVIQRAVLGPLVDSLFGGGAIAGNVGQFAAQTPLALSAGMAPLKFATGGSFKVGGSGGPDSKLFSLALSPGEAVDVRRGDQERAGQLVMVQVDKSALFDVHVQRAAAPLAQAAQVGAVGQVEDRARRRARSRL